MNNLSTLIIPSTTILRTSAESLLSGVQGQDFRRKPNVNGLILNMNHPAFIYGHLSIYPGIVLETFDIPHGEARAPDHFYDLFKKDSVCVDDPDGTLYPEMTEIVAVFRRSYEVLMSRLPTISEEALYQPTVGERIARFPTKGSFLVHLLTSHLGIHLGQMSAWRRAMLLPPAS